VCGREVRRCGGLDTYKGDHSSCPPSRRCRTRLLHTPSRTGVCATAQSQSVRLCTRFPFPAYSRGPSNHKIKSLSGYFSKNSISQQLIKTCQISSYLRNDNDDIEASVSEECVVWKSKFLLEVPRRPRGGRGR